jgi:hypothetical protein
MGILGAGPSFFSMFKNLNAYGALASAPPLPAPGRSVLDTLGFLQVFRNPLDVMFFHSWPDEINEGVTTVWDSYNFMGTSAPLAFVYRQNEWDDYQVKLQIHSSNPAQPLQFTSGSSEARFANAILDILRVQLQVAWCKSVCLPNIDEVQQTAKDLVRQLLAPNQDVSTIIDAFAKSLTKTANFAQRVLTDIQNNTLYAGGLFPPLIACQYGGFLRMYGFCSSCQIRWLPPFVPLTAHPHRAEVTMNFKRFFPFSLPSRTGARMKLGYMM